MVHPRRFVLLRALHKEGRPEDGDGSVSAAEHPPPELVVLAVAVDELGLFRGGEEAEEGLQLVAGHGITDEGEVLAVEEVEESGRVEGRQRTAARLPPPVEVAGVWASMLHAILPLFNGLAAGAVIARTAGVGDPLAV